MLRRELSLVRAEVPNRTDVWRRRAAVAVEPSRACVAARLPSSALVFPRLARRGGRRCHGAIVPNCAQVHRMIGGAAGTEVPGGADVAELVHSCLAGTLVSARTGLARRDIPPKLRLRERPRGAWNGRSASRRAIVPRWADVVRGRESLVHTRLAVVRGYEGLVRCINCGTPAAIVARQAEPLVARAAGLAFSGLAQSGDVAECSGRTRELRRGLRPVRAVDAKPTELWRHRAVGITAEVPFRARATGSLALIFCVRADGARVRRRRSLGAVVPGGTELCGNRVTSRTEETLIARVEQARRHAQVRAEESAGTGIAIGHGLQRTRVAVGPIRTGRWTSRGRRAVVASGTNVVQGRAVAGDADVPQIGAHVGGAVRRGGRRSSAAVEASVAGPAGFRQAPSPGDAAVVSRHAGAALGLQGQSGEVAESAVGTGVVESVPSASIAVVSCRALGGGRRTAVAVEPRGTLLAVPAQRGVLVGPRYAIQRLALASGTVCARGTAEGRRGGPVRTVVAKRARRVRENEPRRRALEAAKAGQASTVVGVPRALGEGPRHAGRRIYRARAAVVTGGADVGNKVARSVVVDLEWLEVRRPTKAEVALRARSGDGPTRVHTVEAARARGSDNTPLRTVLPSDTGPAGVAVPIAVAVDARGGGREGRARAVEAFVAEAVLHRVCLSFGVSTGLRIDTVRHVGVPRRVGHRPLRARILGGKRRALRAVVPLVTLVRAKVGSSGRAVVSCRADRATVGAVGCGLRRHRTIHAEASGGADVASHLETTRAGDAQGRSRLGVVPLAVVAGVAEARGRLEPSRLAVATVIALGAQSQGIEKRGRIVRPKRTGLGMGGPGRAVEPGRTPLLAGVVEGPPGGGVGLRRTVVSVCTGEARSGGHARGWAIVSSGTGRAQRLRSEMRGGPELACRTQGHREARALRAVAPLGAVLGVLSVDSVAEEPRRAGGARRSARGVAVGSRRARRGIGGTLRALAARGTNVVPVLAGRVVARADRIKFWCAQLAPVPGTAGDRGVVAVARGGEGTRAHGGARKPSRAKGAEGLLGRYRFHHGRHVQAVVVVLPVVAEGSHVRTLWARNRVLRPLGAVVPDRTASAPQISRIALPGRVRQPVRCTVVTTHAVQALSFVVQAADVAEGALRARGWGYRRGVAVGPLRAKDAGRHGGVRASILRPDGTLELVRGALRSVVTRVGLVRRGGRGPCGAVVSRAAWARGRRVAAAGTVVAGIAGDALLRGHGARKVVVRARRTRLRRRGPQRAVPTGRAQAPNISLSRNGRRPRPFGSRRVAPTGAEIARVALPPRRQQPDAIAVVARVAVGAVVARRDVGTVSVLAKGTADRETQPRRAVEALRAIDRVPGPFGAVEPLCAVGAIGHPFCAGRVNEGAFWTWDFRWSR
eukprot:scaffold1070_cov245-Pinguiococcus_pyrenoidosus.AAC.2